MLIRQFLKDKFSGFRKYFIDFSPLYEFDLTSNTHFIQVIPEYLMENDEFETKCGELLIEMMETRPNDFICFISSKSLTKLKEPEKLLENNNFQIKISYKLSNDFNCYTPQNPINSGFVFYRGTN